VKAFLAKDADGLLNALLEFGTTPPDFDKARFQADVVRVVQRNGRAVSSQLRGQSGAGNRGETSNSLEAFVTALFRVATNHGVCVPPSTTLLIKTLVTIEGVARSLHPELNLAAVAAPVLLRAAAPRWMKWVLGARA
jgi:ubiquinone biosynthesis protein